MVILFGLFSVFILKNKRESIYSAVREGAGPDSLPEQISIAQNKEINKTFFQGH